MTDSAILDEYQQFAARIRPKPKRSMRQFAEEEIIIPDGPFKARPFRVARQPCAGLWFDLIDSGRWRRHVMTAPSQSGKTLSGFVIPILYHLFEHNETVICGLPSLDMAADKWREDLLPAIEASRYRDLLPRQGAGSRGGKADAIRFRNGVTLKFMSGGGSDKKRAAFTSRVLVITETDGMDESGQASREADKITQMEARTRAFGRRARIYMECTVSIETGRTWQEYTKGTETKIAVPCPHCEKWVVPDREDLVGWQDADTIVEARDASAYACPDCGGFFSEEQRREANQRAKVLHRGQRLTPKGRLKGAFPQVETLGFRYHAFHNLLLEAGDIGVDEWNAARDPDEDNAERMMRQFVWALPHVPDAESRHQLEFQTLIHRTNNFNKGTIPQDIALVTAGVDIGKYLIHWMVCAWRMDATGFIVDYGRIGVASADMPEEKAILLALREWREIAVHGFPQVGGSLLTVGENWIDSGYQGGEADNLPVYQFCRESGPGFQPTKGFGKNQRSGRYRAPGKKTGDIKYIGEGWHVTKLKSRGVNLIHADADFWKSWIHGRLSCPKDQTGALTLFRAEPREHLTLAKHLTAEESLEEFEAGKGVKTVWIQKRKQNHWLDCAYLAAAAANYRGIRLAEFVPETKPQPQPKTRVNLSGPDGRNFFVT